VHSKETRTRIARYASKWRAARYIARKIARAGMAAHNDDARNISLAAHASKIMKRLVDQRSNIARFNARSSSSIRIYSIISKQAWHNVRAQKNGVKKDEIMCCATRAATTSTIDARRQATVGARKQTSERNPRARTRALRR